MTPGRTRSGSARERLIEAASRLFYAHGVVSTGIDTITAEAGVAKMSLYNNFSSKEELVLAYLQERHREWLDLYRNRAETAASPQEKVLAVFDAYIDHASAAYTHGFRGCGLLNAAAELPADSPGRARVRDHKEQVESILTGHLEAITTPEAAARTARHCAFLLEGAIARAGLEGGPDPLRDAREIASAMVAAL
ncbi:AcrR family transcriptional regulator [Nocardiopsis mwathae]|uniref:AcrR family transcriptional regulator n=1 Tax=Nocardiopsis mwathae TaxID=1472723 RepID=A0A7X0D4V0_9ACTN|nr:TetR/AcrR family transcriptional regulator [Nocardiopsis mwathae]MBB6171692.1 AcrR family transcriptional regulator [Nocardiopsis mwathae]